MADESPQIATEENLTRASACVTKLESEYDGLKNEYDGLSKEYDGLMNEYDECKNRVKYYDDLVKINIMNPAVYSIYKDERKNAQTERDRANECLENVHVRLENVRKDLKEARMDLDKAHERLGELQMMKLRQSDLPNQKKRLRYDDAVHFESWIAVANDLTLDIAEKEVKHIDCPKIFFGVKIPYGLCIRFEHSILIGIIEKNLKLSSNYCKVLILGSPGIGKSCFGILLFLLAIKQKKNVAFHPFNSNETYFITWENEQYCITEFPTKGETYEGYFDGNEKGGSMDAGIFYLAYVFASVRPRNYESFAKEFCFTVFMNPWSREECAIFAKYVIPDEKNDWFLKFKLVGGKPRLLFSPESVDSLRHRVKKDIPRTLSELKTQVAEFENDIFDVRMKHIVYMVYRNDDRPSHYLLDYASMYVCVELGALFVDKSVREYRLLLQTPASNLQAWRGTELEKFLMVGLSNDKIYVKALEDPDRGLVKEYGPFLATSTIVLSASEITCELKLFFPMSKTFPAIDGVLVVPSLSLIIYAQVTVSTTHPVIYSALTNVYNALTEKKEFKGFKHMLLFVVSNDVFDNFKYQPYKNTDGKTDRTLKIGTPVKQFVGRIDFNWSM